MTSTVEVIPTVAEKKVYPLTINNLESLLEYRPNSSNPTSITSKVSLKRGAVFADITTATETTEPQWSTLQVGEKKHVDLNSALLYLNHSCSPSLELDTQNMQLRVPRNRDLKVGDELTFFYPSTEWEMAQSFRCSCESSDCLKEVKGAVAVDEMHLRQNRYFVNEHIWSLIRTRNVAEMRL